MTISRLWLALSLALAGFLTIATPAHAQATRTWISGVGDDVNPCSRTAPCKTFAGAISKTAAGGEINCLDPGGFGTVTITKSITLDCSATQGSILASSTNGINVNDSATGTPGTIRVIIRGLTINGAGTTPGLSGISFISGASLTVENCIIQNFATSPAVGIRFQPTGNAFLAVHNVDFVQNGAGAAGGGVRIQPTGAAGGARVAIRNSRFANNANSGITVDSTGNTGPGITLSLDNVEMAGNGAGVGLALSAPAGTTTVGVIANGVTIVNHATGIVANGATLTGRIGNSTISGNATGLLLVGGATLSSYGNNRLDGNPTVGAANNGAFSGIIATK